jgi:hypothetical protein
MDERELVEAYRAGGAEGYWRKRLEILDAAPPARPGIRDFGCAVLHARLGEVDRALDRLERLVEARAGGAVFLAVNPYFVDLHDHPRFKALLKRVGVPTVSARHTVST